MPAASRTCPANERCGAVNSVERYREVKAAYLLCAIPICVFAACGKADPVADEANNTAGLPAPIEANVSDPSGAPPPADANVAVPATNSPAPAATIPAAFHGRWGLTPGDCTSTRGDNKGLLVVSARELRFYESRAVPAGNVNTTEDSFSADFTFTGEGMTWSKFETIEMQDDGLVRTESNPMASFTYARCA